MLVFLGLIRDYCVYCSSLCEALQVRLVNMDRFDDSALADCSNVNVHKLIFDLSDQDVPDKSDFVSLKQLPSRDTVNSVLGEAVQHQNRRRRIDQSLVAVALVRQARDQAIIVELRRLILNLTGIY